MPPCPWPPGAVPKNGFAVEDGYAVCPGCRKGFFVTVLVRDGCFAEVRPSQTLQRKVAAEELEAEQLYRGVPFGYINGRWREFLAGMRPRDELWHFRSPQERWAELRGREGVPGAGRASRR